MGEGPFTVCPPDGLAMCQLCDVSLKRKGWSRPGPTWMALWPAQRCGPMPSFAHKAELWIHLKKNTNSQLKDSFDPMYLASRTSKDK